MSKYTSISLGFLSWADFTSKQSRSSFLSPTLMHCWVVILDSRFFSWNRISVMTYSRCTYPSVSVITMGCSSSFPIWSVWSLAIAARKQFVPCAAYSVVP